MILLYKMYVVKCYMLLGKWFRRDSKMLHLMQKTLKKHKKNMLFLGKKSGKFDIPSRKSVYGLIEHPLVQYVHGLKCKFHSSFEF